MDKNNGSIELLLKDVSKALICSTKQSKKSGKDLIKI